MEAYRLLRARPLDPDVAAATEVQLVDMFASGTSPHHLTKDKRKTKGSIPLISICLKRKMWNWLEIRSSWELDGSYCLTQISAIRGRQERERVRYNSQVIDLWTDSIATWHQLYRKYRIAEIPDAHFFFFYISDINQLAHVGENWHQHLTFFYTTMKWVYGSRCHRWRTSTGRANKSRQLPRTWFALLPQVPYFTA